MHSASRTQIQRRLHGGGHIHTNPQKQALPEGKGFEEADGSWTKGNLFSSGDSARRIWRETAQICGWPLTHPFSAASPEPPGFRMGSTTLSQGYSSKPEEQELPPCTGCPKTGCLSSKTYLLLRTLQSWDLLLLTEAQSCFFWRHHLLLRGTRRHTGTTVSRVYGRHCCSLQQSELTSLDSGFRRFI